MNTHGEGGYRPFDIPAWKDFAGEAPAEAAARAFFGPERCLAPGQFPAVVAQRISEEALCESFARTSLSLGKPLSGVPFYIKDLFDLEGFRTQAGSRFLRTVREPAATSACLVRELEAMGAICTGKAQLHEFAYGVTGTNPHFGDVQHPSFPDRTSGGSSSGSAAIVKAGVVPFSLGTDTGGSIRIPAAFCGLFGFRHVPEHRWVQDVFHLAPSFDTAGWLTRTAADMRRLNELLLGAPASRTRKSLVGCYLPFGSLEPAVAEACVKAASLLCPQADRETAKGLDQAFAGCCECYGILTSAEAASVHEGWLDTHRNEYSEAVWLRIDRGRRWSAEQEGEALVRRQVLQATLASYFLTFDFLVLPAVPCPALLLRDCERYPRERIIELNAPASLAGIPSLALPVSLGGGLTAGLQVIAPKASCAAFERALAIWGASEV